MIAEPYVLIVEDHPIVLQSLRDCVQEVCRVAVAAVTTLSDALLEMDARGTPLLLITDLSLPDSQREATIERLRQVAPTSPLLVFTALDEPGLRQSARKLGVDHYIVKSSSVDPLRSAIAAILGPLMPDAADAAGRTAVSPLTARQRHVMEELATGRSNMEIAERLGVGEETVRSHIKEIFNRLGARNRTECVALYLRLKGQHAG